MSDRTFAWVVVFAAALLGWGAQVLSTLWEIPAGLVVAVGGGLLIAAVERRLSTARQERK